MNRPSILVVGSMNMDLLVYGVPRIAGYGESLYAGSYATLPGGKGANQAVAVARLGGDAALCGRVGDDENGRELMENLAGFGVDSADVLADSATQTGLANILVDGETGRYTCYVVMGGNDRITGEQVEAALARRRYDMVLMQLEMPLETVFRTYELAAARDIPVFLDAGPAMSVPLERLRGIFVISPNEAETQALTGIEPYTEENCVSAAKALYKAASPRYVLLKLGARGAMLYDGEMAELIPCFTRLAAVDSTAAGDTFGAAFAVRTCAGAEVREAIRYAHGAAGLCVSRKGAQSSIPTAAEVEAFLAGQPQ